MSQTNGPLEKHKAVVLDPLTEDQKFVEEIIEDGNLKNNAEIQQLTKQSEDFIQTKHNFWAQQGDATLRKKTSVKRPPQPLSNTLTQSQDISKSQITELDNKQLLARVLQKI